MLSTTGLQNNFGSLKVDLNQTNVRKKGCVRDALN